MIRWLRYFLRSRWFWGGLGITVGLVGFFLVVGDPPWGLIVSLFPLFALISVAEFARLPGFRRRPRVTRAGHPDRADAPTLSKMGGSDWAAAKGKARKAVRDIAVELVKLYSARMASRGHAFGPDTPWQRELEEAFAFAETPEQLTTIDEVKRDMESPIPMDRLQSGDVGYGKMEVAVRAAFKAVQDGKQVAMIVPTTLLVRHHMETFAERFAGFPVHLRALSRFQTDKESKETMPGLADGTVDVVIGTHRLLGQAIAFKDLGLVIIDEEQRFGVEHKDALKKLKTNVGILAMTATPTPRTLEMAVMGIRFSVLLARIRRSRWAPRFAANSCAKARCFTCTTGW